MLMQSVVQRPSTLQHWPAGQVATPGPHAPAGGATGTPTLVRSVEPGHQLRRPENSHWHVLAHSASQRPYCEQHWCGRQNAMPARSEEGTRHSSDGGGGGARSSLCTPMPAWGAHKGSQRRLPAPHSPFSRASGRLEYLAAPSATPHVEGLEEGRVAPAGAAGATA